MKHLSKMLMVGFRMMEAQASAKDLTHLISLGNLMTMYDYYLLFFVVI